MPGVPKGQASREWAWMPSRRWRRGRRAGATPTLPGGGASLRGGRGGGRRGAFEGVAAEGGGEKGEGGGGVATALRHEGQRISIGFPKSSLAPPSRALANASSGSIAVSVLEVNPLQSRPPRRREGRRAVKAIS